MNDKQKSKHRGTHTCWILWTIANSTIFLVGLASVVGKDVMVMDSAQWSLFIHLTKEGKGKRTENINK